MSSFVWPLSEDQARLMKSAFKLVEKSIQFPEKKEKESKPKVSDPIFQIPLPLFRVSANTLHSAREFHAFYHKVQVEHSDLCRLAQAASVEPIAPLNSLIRLVVRPEGIAAFNLATNAQLDASDFSEYYDHLNTAGDKSTIESMELSRFSDYNHSEGN